MSNFDIKLKSAELNLDEDELRTLVDIVGDYNITIIDNDDYELPEWILSKDVDDILEYINNCETLGVGYELYCNNSRMFIEETEYNTYFIGKFNNYCEIVENYLEQFNLPSAIVNSIDYEKLVEELEYCVLDSEDNDGYYYVFTE